MSKKNREVIKLSTTPHMAYKGYVRWLRGLGTVRIYRKGTPAAFCTR
jgi:hypothetical protein